LAAAVAEAVGALDLALVLVAALLPVVALVVLLLQFPAQLLREAQLLRPVLLPAVVAVLLGVVSFEVVLQLLQGLQSFSASTARSSPPPVQPTSERAPSTR
jgi:hypothetical protein